jgi:hypothetical protein
MQYVRSKWENCIAKIGTSSFICVTYCCQDVQQTRICSVVREVSAGETKNPCRILEQESLGEWSSARHRTKRKNNVITLARSVARMGGG